MRHIATSEHHGARHRHTMAAAFWIIVGTVAVVAFGDTLTLLAVALAILATVWWICVLSGTRYGVRRVTVGEDE